MARVVCIRYGLQMPAVAAPADAVLLECIVVQKTGSNAAFIVTAIAQLKIAGAVRMQRIRCIVLGAQDRRIF